MKTLLRKELRANVKVAVLGLAVFILLLAQSYRSASDTVERVVRDGYYGQNYNDLQPLLASTLLMETTLFCAAFGALLGFLQIFHERHQDLWAFLVHRPATRTQIFLSKIGAGLALYLLAAGLPLLFLVAFVATPGHVAAPFEWGMILPVTASFLAGIVYYFAGMLTGLRQARWYGSRGLGLGLALVISLCVSSSLFGVTSDLPLAACFSVIAMGAGFLVLAVWGGFQSNGQYEGQPLAAKGALTLVLSTGAGVVVFAALGLLAMLLGTAGYSWFYYQMDRDGTIYKVMNLPGKPARIVDLQGNPLTD